MSVPVIVLGGGGHAKVLIDILASQQVPVLGFTDPATTANSINGVSYLGDDDIIFGYSKDQVSLVNGIGSLKGNTLRSKIFASFSELGYKFLTVIHSSAIIAADSTIMEGAQIMAGAIIQPGSYIGRNSIINTRAAVDHDCYVGDHVHIAPGVTVSGGVRIGDNTHVGTGTSIIQGINIGHNCVIGAGAVVVKDVRDGATVYGVPAREVKK